MTKPSQKYLMTDSLSLLAKSGQLSQEECESTVQILLDGIDYFTPLRKVPLAEAGDNMLIQIDRAIREHHARPNMEAGKITCRQGCAHCCRISNMGTMPEAVVALNYAEAHDIVIDEARLQRQARHGRDDWFAQPITDQSCIFLTPEQTCAIYPVRPASCRKHAVISEPSHCDVQAGGVNKVARFVVPLAEILYSAFMNMFRGGSWPKVLAIALAQRNKGGTA